MHPTPESELRQQHETKLSGVRHCGEHVARTLHAHYSLPCFPRSATPASAPLSLNPATRTSPYGKEIHDGSSTATPHTYLSNHQRIEDDVEEGA